MRLTWWTGEERILQKIHQNLRRNQNLTDAQKDQQAEHAHQLLNDNTFNDAYSRVLERITDEIICTKAHESSRRDELHAEIRALHRVVHELNAMAAEAVVK